MAATLLLALLAREIILPDKKKHHHISKATAKQMLEREVYLHQELINLLHEIENSKKAEEGLFSGWLFWTAAVGLVLLAVICWLARRRRKRQVSPQSFRVFWPDLPEDIAEIEIGLSVYENNRARHNNLALDVPSS